MCKAKELCLGIFMKSSARTNEIFIENNGDGVSLIARI